MKTYLPKIIVILGPTASGKTKLAVKLAKKINGEIVSADSRQVYKGMDIGSGKDLDEYNNVKYHLIDVVAPKKIFNLSNYQKLAKKAIKDILKRKKTPIICGGTGLYAEAVFDGYSLSTNKPNLKLRKELEQLSLAELQLRAKKLSRSFNESDWKNPLRLIRALEITNIKTNQKKPIFNPQIFAVAIDKDCLKNNIIKRLNKRLKQGMITEVENLHKQGLPWKRLESFGLEYKIISHFLQNKISYEQMKENIISESLKFAKRQITWINRPAIRSRVLWIKNYQELIKYFK